MATTHRALPRLVAGLAMAGLACHVGPAATWLPVVRRRTPRLAGQGTPGHVAITFDDGPDPRRTPRILAALADADVRATFFVIGEQLARHPEVGRMAAEAGHEIAVHGWRHHYLLGRTFGHVYRDLARTRDLVGEISGVAPHWFRPAYGVLTGESALAAARLGLRPILWTAWARDWTTTATPDSVMHTLGPGIDGGATLLLHDAGPAGDPACGDAVLAALPRVIGRIRALGLATGPLSEHGVDDATVRRDRDGHPKRRTFVQCNGLELGS